LRFRASPAAAGLLLFTIALFAVFQSAFAQGDAKRGQYLAKAGGCVGCHTEEKQGAVSFAGGRALKTPFGTFYGPNITPDQNAGIGRWSEADFIQAMRHGLRPDGANYFPAFPYPSFTRIADADLKDLWAYLRSLPPSARPSEAHDLRFPFGWRFLLWIWKWLFFTPGPFTPDPSRSAVLNRGAYLTDALGHCGECHTPRNFLGGTKKSRYLAGGMLPDGGKVPNLTPTRLKKWDDKDLKDFLQTGQTPDGDVVAEAMGEVIRSTTGQLTLPDLDALLAYLRSLPALPDEKK
jgi:mono/diheme cytochrome c family protein